MSRKKVPPARRVPALAGLANHVNGEPFTVTDCVANERQVSCGLPWLPDSLEALG